MKYFDSHCHLDKIYNLNINYLIKNLKKLGFVYILTISTDINNFIFIYNCYLNIDIIYFSCGIHPKYLDICSIKEFKYMERFINYKKVIAIGETGLDYFNNNINKLLQKYYFDYHLYLSFKYNKPIIIHSRSSFNDTLYMINKYKNFNLKFILHCYNYNDKYSLYKLLNYNVYISLSGLITFKNCLYYKYIIKDIPLNKLLVETDSPYLTPVPKRGQINNSCNIIYIIKFISIIKKIKLDILTKILIKNFLNVFKI